ncbi:MAG: hypothetical protein H6652_10475 [Ardenticatenaceae bacterium]|nr:hypothetical protein [Ardenticatenaceae bacterium]
MLTNLKKRVRGTAVYAAVAYLILVLLLTYPAILHLPDRLIGNNIDNWIYYWNNWWIGRAIADGHSWFSTEVIFFPQGTSLLAHSHSLLSSLLAWLLEPLAGPVAAFNLVWLWGMWLGAWGMFLLVDELTKQPVAAFVAGFVFAFAPYHLTQYLAHMHLGTIHWWPFYILFLWLSLRQPGWGNAVLAGVFLSLSFWSGIQQAVFLGLWTAVYLPWWAWTNRPIAWLQTARQLLLLGVAFFVLSLPIVWPILNNLDALVGTAAEVDESIIKQTDLLAYVVPPTYQPLWGEAVVPIYQTFRVNQAFMPYLGLGVLLLCLLAVWKQWREARFWLWSGLVWLVLAAGSQLRFNGTVYESIQLPYNLIKSIFPISAIRTPERFNLLLVVSMAVLVGLAVSWLWQQRQGRWLLPLVGLVLLLDYLPAPLPMWELPLSSPHLAEFAQIEPEAGVVNVPMGYDLAKLLLYYQTLHGHPTVEGHFSRYTEETYAFISQEPILHRLYPADDIPNAMSPELFTTFSEPIVAIGPALRQLNETGVRYFLMHLPYTSPAQFAAFEAQLPLLPIFKDETQAVYDVAQPRPWQFQEPRPLTENVDLLETEMWLTDTAVSLHLVAQLKNLAGVGASCEFVLGENTAVSSQTLLIDPVASWQVGDVAQPQFDMLLPTNIPEGEYPLALRCGAAELVLPDSLLVDAAGQRRLAGMPINAQLGEAIVLQDVRWWSKGSQLNLSLQWLAQAAPQQELKLFVHVLDENGALVRQLDSIPCNWQCPTSQWQADQLITDVATLDLWGLSPGRYQVVVGLYDANLGERLPMIDAGGTAVPNNSFLLPDPIVITLTP